MQNLFSIGETAAIFNETTETLRHYDRVNLLKPHTIKENGYRYYSLDQFELISTILHLRTLGTPITKIKILLNSRSRTKILNELKCQTLEIQKQIKQLQYLEQQATLLSSRFEAFTDQAIKLSNEPTFYVIKENFESEKLSVEYKKILTLKHNIDSEWLKYSNIISIISHNTFLNNNFHKYIGFGAISEQPCNVKNKYYYIIPSKLYITACIRVKTYEHFEVDAIYKKIQKFIINNNLKITDNIFERNILDLYNGENLGDIHYIKIYVPVEYTN